MVNSGFDAPFGPSPFLRAAIVPRWAIIKMAKPQSVAEHSFNVALITRAILSNFIEQQLDDNEIIVAALDHDWAEEIYTGDIPSPAKRPGPVVGGIGHAVIKLADVIEAYVFASKNCIDSERVKEWVLQGLKEKINHFAGNLGIDKMDLWPFIYNMGE